MRIDSGDDDRRAEGVAAIVGERRFDPLLTLDEGRLWERARGQVTMTRPFGVTTGWVAWLKVSSRLGTTMDGGVQVWPMSKERTSSIGVEPSAPKRV